MEASPSDDGGAVLAALRALAKRGAQLRRLDDGSGRIEQADPRRAARPLCASQFASLVEQHLVRAEGEGRFVLSRRGLTRLRAALTSPRPGRTTEPGQGAPTSLPSSAPNPPRSTPAHAGKPSVNPKESPLAWLRQRNDAFGKPLISALEFEAGERLRADFERGQLMPRTTASWDPTASAGRGGRGAPGLGLEMAEAVVAARQRVDAALQAVGPELSGVLLDVCCFLKGLEQAERNGGWPRRAGKVVLQLALAHLARHYGIVPTGRSGVRGWGADGYKPLFDGPETAATNDDRAAGRARSARDGSRGRDV